MSSDNVTTIGVSINHSSSFFDRLINRLLPVAPEELAIVEAQLLTQKKLQEAAQADIDYFQSLKNAEEIRQQGEATAKKIQAEAIARAKRNESDADVRLKDKQAKLIDIQIAREQAAAKEEADLRAEARKSDDVLKIKYTVKHKFTRGKVSDYMLILTVGESKSGKRGIMTWSVLSPAGAIETVTDATREFFRTRELYLNAVLPWIHGEMTTEQLTKVYRDRTKNGWIMFPGDE